MTPGMADMGHHADGVYRSGSDAFAGLADLCLSVFYGNFCGMLHHGYALQAD